MDSCERLKKFYQTEYGKKALAKFIAAMPKDASTNESTDKEPK
jgi:hypothetical protein